MLENLEGRIDGAEDKTVAGIAKAATEMVTRLAQARHGLFAPPTAQTLNIERVTIAAIANAPMSELLRLAGRVDNADVLESEMVLLEPEVHEVKNEREVLPPTAVAGADLPDSLPGDHVDSVHLVTDVPVDA